MKKSKKDILKAIQTIPAMPSAASKIIDLSRDPDVDVEDIKRAIEYDPGLTTNVLRLANSAYFAGPRTVATVKEAIVRLGLARVFQLTVAVAVAPLAWKEVSGYGLKPGQLLEHSISVAVGTEQVASVLNTRAPFHAFTAGILHDVGKVVLGTFLSIDSEPIVQLAADNEVNFHEAERFLLGIDHAEVGAMLLESWNVPDAIVETVRFHHQPEEISAESFTTDLVHVANHLSMQFVQGKETDGLSHKPSHEVMSRMALSPDATQGVVSRMLEGVDQLYHLLAEPGA